MASATAVPRLHGIEAVSSLLGETSPWTVRAHIARGHIKVTRIGKRIFVTEEEVLRIQREGLPSLSVQERKQRGARGRR